MTIGSSPASSLTAGTDALLEIGNQLQAGHGFMTELVATSPTARLRVIRPGIGVAALVTVNGSKVYVFGDLYLGRLDDPSKAAARLAWLLSPGGAIAAQTLEQS